MMPDDSSQESTGAEYVETSFDWDMEATNNSINIDSLLKPLSDSQQALMEDLDIKDEKIKSLKEDQERQVREEQELVKKKHEVKPSYIQARAPGIKVFRENKPAVFRVENLSLEKDFNWSGRRRLENSGYEKETLDRILGSGEDNLFEFVRHLTPGMSDNTLVTSQAEFVSIVNYVLYSASICKKDILFSVLKKCLFDLLKSYNYSWTFTVKHFVTVMLNFRAEPQFMCNERFFEAIEELAEKPKMDDFFERKVNERCKAEITLDTVERNSFVARFLEIVTDLIRLPHRIHKYESVDKSEWKTLIYLTALISQDSACLKSPRVMMSATNFLHCLLDFVKDNSDVQDVVEMISNRFLPREISSEACSWSLETCPPHMARHGHNHPHNMLHLTSVFPRAVRPVQQLLAYIYIQIILGNSNVDLPDPGEVSLEDVMTVLERDAALWVSYTEDRCYTVWCLLQILDILVDVRVINKPVASGVTVSEFDYMKRLVNFIDKHCIAKFKDQKSSRNLDQTIMTEMSRMMVSRWRVNMDKTENEQKLRSQRGKW